MLTPLPSHSSATDSDVRGRKVGCRHPMPVQDLLAQDDLRLDIHPDPHLTIESSTHARAERATPGDDPRIPLLPRHRKRFAAGYPILLRVKNRGAVSGRAGAAKIRLTARCKREKPRHGTPYLGLFGRRQSPEIEKNPPLRRLTPQRAGLKADGRVLRICAVPHQPNAAVVRHGCSGGRALKASDGANGHGCALWASRAGCQEQHSKGSQRLLFHCLYGPSDCSVDLGSRLDEGQPQIAKRVMDLH